MGNFDSFAFTDSISLNANSQVLSDSMAIVDSVSRTDQSTGTFVIDTAQIDFSDVG